MITARRAHPRAIEHMYEQKKGGKKKGGFFLGGACLKNKNVLNQPHNYVLVVPQTAQTEQGKRTRGRRGDQGGGR